jgi:outer membrane protein
MPGPLKFFLILSLILIAAPASASDTGKAAKETGFANVSSVLPPPAPLARAFTNASSSANGSPSLIKLPPAPHAVAPSTTPQASAKAMTLEDCMAIALGEHPSIKGASSDVDFGRFRTLGAESNYYPQFSFTGTFGWINTAQPISGLPAPFSGTFLVKDNYQSNVWGFTGNWVLFDFGRTYYSVRSNRELETALMKTLTNVQENVVYDVRDAYFNLLRAQTLVKVAEDTLGQADSHLRQAQGFFDAGVKPRYDVTSAEVEVNNAKVQIIQAYDAVTQARINLNTRMTVAPMTPTVVVDMPALEPLDKTLDQYLASAVSNRPDIQALEAQQKADELSVRGACAGFLPTITASGSYNWNKLEHISTFENSNYQLGLNVPLFQGFATVAQVGQARAAALSAKYSVENAKLNVLNDVASAYLSVQDAKARTEALEVSVQKAQENLEIAQGRYEAGVGNIIDVTDAEVLLTTAKTDRAQAYYDYHLAYSKLLRSTGAGVVE